MTSPAHVLPPLDTDALIETSCTVAHVYASDTLYGKINQAASYPLVMEYDHFLETLLESLPAEYLQNIYFL